jgi:hypothetical protein
MSTLQPSTTKIKNEAKASAQFRAMFAKSPMNPSTVNLTAQDYTNDSKVNIFGTNQTINTQSTK